MKKYFESVDFSYMDFPEESVGRVFGRREEADKLARKYCESLGVNYDEFNHGTPNSPFMSAYMQICLLEANKTIARETEQLKKYEIKI